MAEGQRCKWCGAVVPVYPHNSDCPAVTIELRTALTCLKFCTNHTDQERIRKAFGIPGPYEKCPNCQVYLSHKSECVCMRWV